MTAIVNCSDVQGCSWDLPEGQKLNGSRAPRGRGPNQSTIEAEGNAYLERGFPELDYVKRAGIVTQ